MREGHGGRVGVIWVVKAIRREGGMRVVDQVHSVIGGTQL